MKSKFALLPLLSLAGSLLFTQNLSHGATLYWDNTAGGAINDGGGAWLGAGLWNDNGTPSASWTSGDNAIFGNSGVGGAVTLGAGGTSANSVTFNYNITTAYTLGTAGNTLTLGSGGITKNAGTLATSIASPIALSAAQTWTNISSTNLTLNNAAGTNLGSNNLIIDGTGSTIFTGAAGNVISGSGGSLTKNGTGYLELGGAGTAQAHTYTGTTTINGGVIQVYNIGTTGVPSGNLTINNGILQDYFGNGGSFTRALGSGAGQVQILGGTSGFSGAGATSTTFNVGGAGATLLWGSSFFNPSVFALQSASSVNTNGKMSLTNGINLNGVNRTITSLQTTDGAFDSGATIAGVISNSTGTAGFSKTGLGNLRLTAANTYNGGTTINSGSITLSGSGTINSTNALNLGGGILRLINTANTQRFADSAAITVSAGGGITYENTAGANLNYTETLGSVALNGGLLNVNLTTNQNNATNNSQTLTIGGLTPSGTGSVAFSAATTGPQASGGDNMIVVSGAGTTTAGDIIGSLATTGTTAALQTDYAVYNSDYVTAANISASDQSGWSTDNTTGTGTLNNTSSALFSATLSATRNINSLRSTNTAASAVASNANITITGHALSVGDVVTFSATTMPTGLTAGTPYYVAAVGSGTIQVSASSTLTPIITPTGASTAMFANSGIQVASSKNLGTTGILNGSVTTLNIVRVSGAGIITLPTTTAGNLYINTGSGAIISNAPISNNTGALTLVKNGSGTLVLTGANNAYTGDTIVNSGTLQVGASQISTQLNGGSYSGKIFIAAGANFTMQGNATNALSGEISGDGNLNLNRGTTTLSGANKYTGKTSMTLVATNAIGSTLNVSSFNSVVGGAATSSLGAPTTVANGTIDFGGTGIQQTATINYTGGGETTDRVINFQFNGTSAGTRVITNNGTAGSLLKFTSAPTSPGSGSNGITLGGSANGEFTQGLPFPHAGLITKNGGGTWTLGGAVGTSGGVTLDGTTLGSRLNINHSQALGTGTFTTSGTTNRPTIGNTSGAAITITTNNAQTWNSDFDTDLDHSLNMGTGAVTLGANRIVRVAGAGTFTVGGVISGAFSLQVGSTGTMALTNQASTYTGKTLISTGTSPGSLKVQITKLANLSQNSSLGAPTTAANGLIQIGQASHNATLELINSTSASSTDRQIQIGSSANGSGGSFILNNNTDSAHTLTFSNAAFNIASTGVSSSFSRALRLGGSNTGNNTITGAIIPNTGGTTTSLIKQDAGTWVLNGAISLDGTVSVTGGLLVLGSSSNSYTGATNISGGTLALSANNVLPDGSNVSIGAATLDAVTFTDTAGTLDTTGAAVINLGSGGALAFADSSAVDWTGGTLNITGTFVSGSSIRFGTSADGLTTSQKNSISVNGSGAGTYSLDANGYVISGANPEIAISQGGDITSGGSKGFGTVTLGSNASLTFTISNSGTGSLNLTGSPDKVAVSGANAGDFIVTAQPTTPVTSGGGTTTFTVQFTPGAAGARSAVLTIANDDSDEGSFTINVSGTGQTLYTAWADATYSPALTQKQPGDDQDSDGFINLMEYAFGTPPTVSSAGSIVWDDGGAVTNPGQPVAINLANPGVDFRAVFGRRKDYVAAGLTYTVEFSAGLDVWVPSGATPTVLTGAGGLNPSEIEAVSVPYPLLIDVGGNNFKKPTFFRVTVSN